jgi:hypothetical protein
MRPARTRRMGLRFRSTSVGDEYDLRLGVQPFIMEGPPLIVCLSAYGSAGLHVE